MRKCRQCKERQEYNMDRKLRVGIVGTGGISQYHMMGYQALPDTVEVVACCDIDGEKAKKYAEKYGIPAVYTDCREMYQKENLDAISVTTWNSAHCDPTIEALEAGINVLCEKPMALNAAQAQKMLDTAKRTGKLLEVGFVRRFGKDAEAIKKCIDAGLLGDIYYAKAVYLRRRGCPGGWFGDKAFSGGGPLIDLGVHVMDLVRYLSGSPMPISAFGSTFSGLPLGDDLDPKAWFIKDGGDHPFNVEDFTSGVVKFDNGLTLTVEASFNLNIEDDYSYVELFGTKAGIRLDPFKVYTKLSPEDQKLLPKKDPEFEFEPTFCAEIAHFVDCCRNGTLCRAPAEDGVVLMKMIDAIYKSAETGKSVDIH